jgi:hypothetical protein
VSAVAELLGMLSDDELAELAERLRPHLQTDSNQPEDSWLRGAAQIAAYIGAPRSRVYSLVACRPPRIPVLKDGSALVARKSKLDEWIRAGGGRRP